VDRNLGNARRIGWSTAAIVALGGLFVLAETGDRLGSPNAFPNDFIPNSVVESIKVEAVLVLILAATLGIFLIVCRRWATGATGVHPFWVLGPGVVAAIGAAALVFSAEVVRYAPPLVSLAEGRAVLDGLLADLRDDGKGVYQPILAGDHRLALDGPPELARLAASVEPVVSRCIDGVGRDTGAVRVGWSFTQMAAFPESGLTGRSPNGLTLPLPDDFVDRFVAQAGTALKAAGFEVEPSDLLAGYVDASGTRASPVRAKDYIAYDGAYSFVAGIFPDPDLDALDGPPTAFYRLQFDARSPCLRPG